MTAEEHNLPRRFSTVFGLLQSLKSGDLTIILPDSRKFKLTGKNKGPVASISVLNQDFFARVIREGENGFCESYLDGWWKTPDLLALLDLLLINGELFGTNLPGAALLRFYERMRHWLRSNSRWQAKKNISYHYDLGNDFYTKWLDNTMTYSSAFFETGRESLKTAQTKKYSLICDSLGVKSEDHILEIGCGWGGFMEYAIKQRGVKVTGLTISKEQFEYSQKRIFEGGFNDKASVVLRDYRDERGVYDGVASIEMFEAVGEKYWPAYFNTVRESLKVGAKATLQIITISDEFFPNYRKNVDFIQKYIFPGGMLPSPKALEEQILNAGLQKIGSREFGKSYSKTLRIWYEQFNSVWSEIAPLGFDERFKRMWNFYIASCAAFFLSETGDVTQITLKK
ncbi:MAG: cyclopropane-fatty-acyl-phospholipid synthase family protein [Pseudomonadota bacterium]|nr:cyclopropane-fatty-acyl-phospholipid synthase family protein [Pseudomonadota bacterium]